MRPAIGTESGSHAGSRRRPAEVAGEGTRKQPLKGEAELPREETLANTYSRLQCGHVIALCGRLTGQKRADLWSLQSRQHFLI